MDTFRLGALFLNLMLSLCHFTIADTKPCLILCYFPGDQDDFPYYKRAQVFSFLHVLCY